MELTLNDNRQLFGVVLFCGIPASGKSTFIKELISLKDKYFDKYEIVYLNFDSYFENTKNTQKSEILDYKKEMGNFYAYCIDIINNKIKSKHKNEIIFIEDNLPLKSSRKIFYNIIYENIKIYKERIVSFTEIIFNTSEELCIHLNNQREKKVPDYIIKSMSVIDNSFLAKNSFNVKLVNENSCVKRKICFNSDKKIIEIIDFKLFSYYLIEALTLNYSYIEKLIEKNKTLEEGRKLNDNKDYSAKLLDKLELALKQYISNILSKDECKLVKVKEISKLKSEFYNSSKLLLKQIINNLDHKDNTMKNNFYNNESFEKLKVLISTNNNIDDIIEFILIIFKKFLDVI